MNQEITASYLHALTGDAYNTVCDWRAIHDTDRSLPAYPFRGTLSQVWETICGYNAAGYGVFLTPAAMDGTGRLLENVHYLRANYVDLDKGSVEANAQRAAASHPAPCFQVRSSPGKVHIYWCVEPYQGNDRFETLQRKLVQTYDSDPQVIDATRVMRVPGTINHKYGSPGHLVTCEALPGYTHPRTTIEAMEAAYAHVQVIHGGAGERHELGEPELAAPSLEWLQHALALVDPNDLDRLEWISMTAAVKQSGWTLTDPDSLYAMWLGWCARYANDNPAENAKNWHSIRNTELGWHSLVRRVPSLKASMAFGKQGEGLPQAAPMPITAPAAPPMPAPPALDCSGSLLTHIEQKEWFKGCVFVVTLAQVLGPDGTFYNQTMFNGAFGGKRFVIDENGKATDEAWKAATRSTLWTIPKVHHTRFLPQSEPGAIVKDSLGRLGVNMYVPPIVDVADGDPAPFLNHIAAIIPDEGDRRILFDWMAHIIKYPGFKIPWAPVIQSAEGVGKGVIKNVMTHAIGLPYVHFPDAQQLGESGGKFNGWMKNRVFILADEIKVDEKRHLIEVLKPLISEKLIEVQSKGVDQKMEDNCANWGFFTNYKDAIPINRNGRRYAIFYSPIQSEADILARGMGDDYMKAMFDWLDNGGCAIVTNWFRNYPIERGAIPMRAPKTTSWAEAVSIGRSPVERVIHEAVDAGLPGFAGGWISAVAVAKRARLQGAVRGNLPPHVIVSMLEGMGYAACGRAPRPFAQDDPEQRAELFHLGGAGDVALFGRAQGWE